MANIAHLVKGDGTSNWGRPKVLLLLSLWSEVTLETLGLRFIELLHRNGSCWYEGTVLARLRCNIDRFTGLLLWLWTSLITATGLGTSHSVITDIWTTTRSSKWCFSTWSRLFIYGRFCGCWDFTINGRRGNTSAGLFVKNESGWATLETGVSSLAGPVSFTRGTKWYIGIRILSTERMFLAACNIGWPITSMSFLVVEKSTNTELLSCSSIPASPITSAGSFMAENTVQPITVFSGDGRVSFRSVKAVNFVVVVADSKKSSFLGAIVDESIGAGLVNGFTVKAFIVGVTLGLMGRCPCLLFARVSILGQSCAQHGQ